MKQLLLTLLLLSGTISSFATTYPGNGNSSFGSPVGNGSLSITNDGANINFVFTRGGGNMNDVMVIYIDSKAGGYNTTANFTDNADGSREAISGYNSSSNKGTINFNSNFLADYAIAVGPAANGYAGLFALSSGSFTAVQSANISSTSNSSATYSFSIPISSIGLAPGTFSFNFAADYISNTGYLSNEAIGLDIPGSFAGGWATVNTTTYDTYSSGEFITVWNNGKTSSFSYPSHSANDTIVYPGIGSNYNIYWEDTTNTSINGTLIGNGNTLIPFPSQSVYRVKVTPGTGTFTGFNLATEVGDETAYNNTPAELVQVSQWGDIPWTSLDNAFYGATNMDVTATDIPNLSGVTDLNNMFNNCTNMAGNPSFSSWDLSTINNTSSMFYAAHTFNQDITGWNVSNVTNMNNMFAFAISFNQPIGSWNVGNVTNMNSMFTEASTFNQPLNAWNVGNVTDMGSMFAQDHVFNQNLNNWTTGNVTDMSGMFGYAAAFNGNITGWNTGNVTTMYAMFANDSAFNQPIGSWNTGNVTTMNGMFSIATSFNQDISTWNVSQVQDMSLMFAGAAAFNQPLNNWNTASAKEVPGMFYDATAFNQPLNNWNMSAVSQMDAMFYGASAFNQKEGSWNISTLQSAPSMFANSGLSCVNYDSTLIGWANNVSTPSNIDFSGEDGMVYSSAAGVAARNTLINTKTWTINGDTYDATCDPTSSLPVQLESFQATRQGNTTLLTWSTATEINNKGFEVQRSTDKSKWTDVHFVITLATNGNSAKPLDYSYVDNSPSDGTNYYRLAQENNDNTNISYSPISTATFPLSTKIYPNPAKSILYIESTEMANYVLINTTGVTVLKGQLTDGKNSVSVGNLSNGIYYLRIETNNVINSYKIEVKN